LRCGRSIIDTVLLDTPLPSLEAEDPSHSVPCRRRLSRDTRRSLDSRTVASGSCLLCRQGLLAWAPAREDLTSETRDLCGMG